LRRVLKLELLQSLVDSEEVSEWVFLESKVQIFVPTLVEISVAIGTQEHAVFFLSLETVTGEVDVVKLQRMVSIAHVTVRILSKKLLTDRLRT
jgi:hypothetical protein